MSTTTLSVDSLISGYETYASPAEFALTDFDTAPALSPTPSIVSFFTASSAECVAFSVGITAGSVGTTLSAGC